MNCRPTDLAYIIAPYHEIGRGHVVTIIRSAKEFEKLGPATFWNTTGRPAWVVEGRVPMESGHVETMLVINDDCLRPIRDPGDDAVDEIARRVPAPRQAVNHDAEVIR